ncbi:MAG: hypothetical protein AAFR61_14230 [Bacteroidota bacterium]
MKQPRSSLMILMFFFLGLSAPALCFGQKKINLTYHSNGNWDLVSTQVKNLKKNEYYQVVIDSINLNLYEVVLTKRDTVISSALSIPAFSALPLDELRGLIGDIVTGGLSLFPQAPPQEVPPRVVDFNKPFNLQAAEGTKFIPVAGPGPGVKSILEKVNDHLQEADSQIPVTRDSLLKLTKSIDRFNYDLEFARLSSLQNFPATPGSFDFASARTKIDGIRARFFTNQTTFYAFQNSTIKAGKILFEELASRKGAVEAALKKKNAELGNAKTPSAKKAKLREEIPPLTIELGRIKELELKKALLDTSLSTIRTALDKLQEITSAEKVSAALEPLAFIENNALRRYVSIPMQLEGEETQLKIELKPRAADKPIQPYQTTITFPTANRGYQGVGVSLIISGLYDEAYSFRDSVNVGFADSLAHQIVNENPTKVELGTAALLRLGIKNEDNNAGVHFSIGVGTSLGQRIRPRFLLGGGLAIGKKHMATIDVGGIIGYVERISQAALPIDRLLETKPESITVSNLQARVFVGFGYLYQF